MDLSQFIIDIKDFKPMGPLQKIEDKFEELLGLWVKEIESQV